jgi:hypothetical protein
MRQNEADVLRYLRTAIKGGHPVNHDWGFGTQWRNALDRLEKAGKVVYVRSRSRYKMGYFKPVRYARPVTA